MGWLRLLRSWGHCHINFGGPRYCLLQLILNECLHFTVVRSEIQLHLDSPIFNFERVKQPQLLETLAFFIFQLRESCHHLIFCVISLTSLIASMERFLCYNWSENNSVSIESVVRRWIALLDGKSRKTKGLLTHKRMLRKCVRKNFLEHFLSKSVLLIIIH